VLEDPLDSSGGIASDQAAGNSYLHLQVSYCSHCTVNRLQQSAKPSGEPQHTPQIQQQQQQQQQQHFSKPAHSPARSGIISSSSNSPIAGRVTTPTAASAAAAAATGSSGYLTPQARSPMQRTPAAAPYSASAAEQYRSVQDHNNIKSSKHSGTSAGALRSAATSRVTALRSWSAVKQHAGEHEMCNSGSGSGSESCSSSGTFDGDTGASDQHQVISCLLCYACIQSAASCGSCCSACATGFSLKLHIGFTCAEQATVHQKPLSVVSHKMRTVLHSHYIYYRYTQRTALAVVVAVVAMQEQQHYWHRWQHLEHSPLHYGATHYKRTHHRLQSAAD
jgi:hypothetical protein